MRWVEKQMLPGIAYETGDSTASLSENARAETTEDLRIAALIDEFEAIRRGGKEISLDTFLARNQDVAAQLKECLEGLLLLEAATPSTPALPTLLAPGMCVGDFEIERQLGGGSMGVVYQAKQISLGRSVALKVLTPSPSLSTLRLERFRREVTAASSLDHPNIVPVYQVGEHLGLHYYAMRRIDGQSLDRPAALGTRPTRRGASRQDFRALAGKFAEVADALHAAHQQGIVHRDIKPSNLIADHSGRIWVADFGLARQGAIDCLTQSGEIIGTLRYMSPEQARGRSDAIDGRTDVYGLGVTLYELLCDQPPFCGFEGIDLLRIIQEGEPTSLRRLNPKVPRDLVTIVHRAMRPEMSDRYQSAGELAADLRRFAIGQPIAARSVSLAERGFSWTRRNLTFVLASLALSLIALVATLTHNQRLRWEQARTERAADAASRNYAEARRAVDQLGARLAERLSEIPGTEALRHELLADTLGYYERFVAASVNDPWLRLDVAKSRLELARLHALLGDYSHAEEQYATAASALKDSEDPESQSVWTQAVNELAMLLSQRGQQHSALRQLEQISLPDFESASQAAVNSDDSLSLALTLNNLAIINARLRRTDDAVGYLRRAIRLLGAADQHPFASHKPIDPHLQSQLADAMSNLSTLMSEQQRDSEALSLAQHAVRLRSALGPTDAAAMQHHAIAQSNLAAILMRSNKGREAITSFQTAIDLFERVRESRPHDPLVDSRLAVALNNCAMAEYALGHANDAVKKFHQAQVYAEASITKQPDNPTNHLTAAGIMNNLGVLLRDTDRSEEARLAFEAAVQFQAMAAKLSPGKAHDDVQLSRIQNNLESLEAKP